MGKPTEKEIIEIRRSAAVQDMQEQAYKASSAAFAIKWMGNMLHRSQEDQGFEAMNHSHWASIGIAIEQLAEYLEDGPLECEEDPKITELKSIISELDTESLLSFLEFGKSLKAMDLQKAYEEGVCARLKAK